MFVCGGCCFLSWQAYSFYKALFWNGIGGRMFSYAYDSVLCLNEMAEALFMTTKQTDPRFHPWAEPNSA